VSTLSIPVDRAKKGWPNLAEGARKRESQGNIFLQDYARLRQENGGVRRAAKLRQRAPHHLDEPLELGGDGSELKGFYRAS
jgi:hypothetical protein